MKKLVTATLAIALMLGATASGSIDRSDVCYPPRFVRTIKDPIVVKPRDPVSFSLLYSGSQPIDVRFDVLTAPWDVITLDNTIMMVSNSDIFFMIKDVGDTDTSILLRFQLSNRCGTVSTTVRIDIRRS
ncbi:hypothetical protein [Alistipes sp.]|uniref:hypothetical protein n=1 Tax=Alistipes sp. TaxID=1872444 RepID=UPI003AF15349